MNDKINSQVLMSGADFFKVEELNPYSHQNDQPDTEEAMREHQLVRRDLEAAGVQVIKVDPPGGCQDGIYTANWGLCRGNKVILSSLPNRRQAEMPFADKVLRDLGKDIIRAPYLFSGQGDAVPCGDLLFCGSTYRTDPRMHDFIAEQLGYTVIGVQAIPEQDAHGQSVINQVTGLPNSFFYDLDLAIAVISSRLIAWCPEALLPESQERIRALDIEKIEVSLDEAERHFACNLVSTGDTVIMSATAPVLKAALEDRGFNVVTPVINQLNKGGGYIRCTTLTLDN